MKRLILVSSALVLFPICAMVVGVHICARLANSNRFRSEISLPNERKRKRHRMAIKQALLDAAQKRRADLPL